MHGSRRKNDVNPRVNACQMLIPNWGWRPRTNRSPSCTCKSKRSASSALTDGNKSRAALHRVRTSFIGIWTIYKNMLISPDTDPKPIRTFSVSCSATSTAYFVMKLANFEVPRVPRVTVYWPIYLQCLSKPGRNLWLGELPMKSVIHVIQIMGVHGFPWEAGSCCAPKRMGSQFWTWGDVPWRGPASPLNGNPAAAGTIWYPLVNCYITMKITIFNGKTHYKWPFSIAMLNYQSVKYPFHSISRVANKFHSERVVHSFTFDLMNLRPLQATIFASASAQHWATRAFPSSSKAGKSSGWGNRESWYLVSIGKNMEKPNPRVKKNIWFKHQLKNPRWYKYPNISSFASSALRWPAERSTDSWRRVAAHACAQGTGSHSSDPPEARHIFLLKSSWKWKKTFGCVWKCCVPLNPMVLLIIIPIKWLFHWEYTLFSDKPKWCLSDPECIHSASPIQPACTGWNHLHLLTTQEKKSLPWESMPSNFNGIC